MAFTDKDEQMILDLTTKDLLGTFMVEFNHQRQRLGFDELDNGLRGNFSFQSNLRGIEILQKKNSGIGGDFVLFENSSIGSDTETEIVNLLGSSQVLLGGIRFKILKQLTLELLTERKRF